MQQHASAKPDFYVVSQCQFLNERAFDLSVRCFLKFFHSLTPKHQRRVRHVLVDPSPQQANVANKQNAAPDFTFPIFSQLRSTEQSELDNIRRNEAVLLHPTAQMNENARVELLSMCLPILTFNSWERAHSFDTAACVFVNSSMEEASVREFSQYLRILYHDSGALKMLRTRALGHRRSVGSRLAAV